jgi:hypothetical protein
MINHRYRKVGIRLVAATPDRGIIDQEPFEKSTLEMSIDNNERYFSVYVEGYVGEECKVIDSELFYDVDEARQKVADFVLAYKGAQLRDLDDGQRQLDLYSHADTIGHTSMILRGMIEGDDEVNQLFEGANPVGLFQFVGVACAVGSVTLKERDDYEEMIEDGIYIDIVDAFADYLIAFMKKWHREINEVWTMREIDVAAVMHDACDDMKKAWGAEKEVLIA